MKKDFTMFLGLVMLFTIAGASMAGDMPDAVLVIIDQDTLSQIGNSYEDFKNDLTNEGFTVSEESISSDLNPPEIKSIIKNYYSNPNVTLKGVFLIGKIKAPYVIAKTGDWSSPNSLKLWLSLDACDMYYEDLDGNWDHITLTEYKDIISNPPSKVVELNQYDSCTTFQNEYIVSLDKDKEWAYNSVLNKEQYSIEIWVSRVFGHNLSITNKTEIDILNDYFKSNHLFRIGKRPISDTAIILSSGSGYNEQEMDYSKIFREVIKSENTTKEIYVKYLKREVGSKLIYLTAHSWPKGHQLSDLYFTSDDMLDTKKNSVFYLLNACSSCRWDEYVSTPSYPNYMGGLYVFDKSHTNGDFGLGAIGFTGVGGFNNLKFFTDYYNNYSNSNYGQMFVYWFNKNLQINFSPHNYVFLGDPTISPNNGGTINLADTISFLQFLCGMNSDIKIIDINGDNKVGLEEIIFSLQVVSGLKFF